MVYDILNVVVRFCNIMTVQLMPRKRLHYTHDHFWLHYFGYNCNIRALQSLAFDFLSLQLIVDSFCAGKYQLAKLT